MAAASAGRKRGGVAARQGIQSIEIGSALLDVMAQADGPLELRDIAAGAGMSASKAHRYLVSLLRCGLVQQDPLNGRYDLGTAALKLGLAGLTRLSMVRFATEAIIALNQRFDVTTMLGVWGSHGPTVIGMYNSTQQAITNVNVGSVLPLLRSASGRVFLAYLPGPLALSCAERELQRSPGDAVDIGAIIAEVRARGLGSTHGDLIRGESAVAAPVFDHEGRIAACITLLGLSGTIETEHPGSPSHALIDTARSVSERIGFWGQMPGGAFAEWLDVLRDARRDEYRPPPVLINPPRRYQSARPRKDNPTLSAVKAES